MAINSETGLPIIRSFDGEDWWHTKTYQRNLPHWEYIGSTYFITICVDKDRVGKPFLDEKLAKFMVDFLSLANNDKYLLYAFVVMPDHIHLIIKPLNNTSLAKIYQHLKGSSAYQINKMVGRSGRFWQDENFDHIIRSNKWLEEKWEYVKENPVKAGLVRRAEDYPFSSFYQPNEAEA